MDFLKSHDLTWSGDFPLNTHGGQLSYGQAGGAGGMSQVNEAVHQIRHEAIGRQVTDCETAFVSGTGGVMSEQSALILRGE
jgi:acetyl-CoA acetyltransferase